MESTSRGWRAAPPPTAPGHHSYRRVRRRVSERRGDALPAAQPGRGIDGSGQLPTLPCRRYPRRHGAGAARSAAPRVVRSLAMATRAHRLVAALAMTTSLGCHGARLGTIAYDGGDPRAPGLKRTGALEVYDLQCLVPVAAEGADMSGGRDILGDRRVRLEHGCSIVGQGSFRYPILGFFSVPDGAVDHWEAYRAAVRERARALGCPGVAIMVDGPSHVLGDQGFGAVCIEHEELGAPDDSVEGAFGDPGERCTTKADCQSTLVCREGLCASPNDL